MLGLAGRSRRVAAVDDVKGSAPLAVDLDGALLKTDTLYEGFCQLARKPRGLLAVIGRALAGKAAIKRAVTQAAPIDVATLPYNEDVVAYLRRCKAEGRRIGLFTAADQSIADEVAAHLDVFDVAVGSNGAVNLNGARKAQAIEDAFGPSFSYLGDHQVDLPIFDRAQTVALAGPVDRLRRRLAQGKPVEACFPLDPPTPRDWARALRLKHWSKNLLVFAGPVLAADPSPQLLGQSVLLFVLFGLMASATYLINDLLDLTADRAHVEKRHRPLAASRISLRAGAAAAIGLLAVTAWAALAFLPAAATLTLGAYLAATLTYSFYLKTKPVADILVLAGLFTLRILAGSLLVPAGVSPWLLSFSVLFFLGLAAVKRYAELNRALEGGRQGIKSRGYSELDLPLLLAVGVGSALSATVIFAVYLIQEQYPRDIYAHPQRLWAMMPVLLGWLLRVWRLTAHGMMNEDPVLFALRDRVSLALGALLGLILILAWL